MYETIVVGQKERVVTIRLNRPNALNALNSQVMEEIIAAMTPLDRDPEVGCFVLPGSERAFAEPGTVGTRAFLAIRLAAVLSPSMSRCSGWGPTKAMPASAQARAKSGFWERNPYPG